MNFRLNQLLYALVFSSILTGTFSYASDIEDSENQKRAASISVDEFVMIEETPAIDQDDPFASVEMSTFNDAIKFDTMHDLEVLDKNASQVIGLATKDTVNRALGRPGRAITWATGVIAKYVFGKETLTEVAINAVRSPFKIEGPYPETVAGVVGKKTQAVVNNLIPRGTIITTATGFVGQKAFGTPTLTQGLIEYVAKKKPLEEKDDHSLDK